MVRLGSHCSTATKKELKERMKVSNGEGKNVRTRKLKRQSFGPVVESLDKYLLREEKQAANKAKLII